MAMSRTPRAAGNGVLQALRRLTPAAQLLLGGAAALLLFQVGHVPRAATAIKSVSCVLSVEDCTSETEAFGRGTYAAVLPDLRSHLSSCKGLQFQVGVATPSHNASQGCSSGNRANRPRKHIHSEASRTETAQVLVFSGFHGRSSETAVRLQREAALEHQLQAVMDDNVQLRSMFKQLENQLTFASAELGCASFVIASRF